ncbi:MAG TPA: hypothetical protein DCE00_00215 [Firmicutes bacterium]|jgi:hypothetical protein|nr:hypothetical protein [Bacillota bacterium]HAA37273.1 hypothetical protein [Bacillota bacterium]
MSEDFFVQENDRPTEAEIVFHSTTSKKHLSGVRGRASRTGRTGPIRTPVDFLSGKAKKEYMKCSEVKVYNMYENQVLPYEEFKELPIEKQVVLMTKWRDEFTTNNIIRDMKISRKKFYSEVLKTLGIETKPRGRRPKKTEAEEQKAEQTEENKEEVSAEIVPAVSVVSVQEEQESSFYIVFNGRISGHQLANRLARLARVLDDARQYEIKVEVRELV